MGLIKDNATIKRLLDELGNVILKKKKDDTVVKLNRELYDYFLRNKVHELEMKLKILKVAAKDSNIDMIIDRILSAIKEYDRTRKRGKSDTWLLPD